MQDRFSSIVTGTRPAGCPAGRLLCLLLALSAAACSARPASTGPAPPVASPVSAPASAASATGNRFPANLVLSVLYFDDRSGVPDLAWLRKGMADMLVAEFARMPSVLVMQRERMEEVFREQAFQLSGRVADESVVRVGRIAGATVLVTGSVSVVDGKLRIDAQLQGVEQGTILGTASAEGRLTDVSSTARTLVAKVAELLPNGSEHRVTTEQDGGQGPGEGQGQGQGQGMVQAAKANDAGEVLSRQGKLFQALEEFERAVAADPTNPSARTNYSQAVRNLSGADLLRSSRAGQSGSGDRQLVARVVERLAGSGLVVEIGAARAETGADGALTVRVPVQIRLSAPALDAVTESSRAMGGKSDQSPARRGQAGAGIELTLASRPDLNREFTRQLGSPRRLYLRLLSTDGRTIALYSGWRDWQLSKWIAPMDEQRVQIKPDHVLAAEAVFAGLAPEQVAGVAGARLTVEPAPRERVQLRLEAAELEEVSRAPVHQPPLQWGRWEDSGAPIAPGHAMGPGRAGDGGVLSEKRPEIPQDEPRPGPGLDAEAASDPQTLQTLRHALEQAWSPPVTERGWSRGYLPSNERTAVVLAVIEPGAGIREDPRLSKPSGDREFDQAAVAATRQALQRWMAAMPAKPDPIPPARSESGDQLQGPRRKEEAEGRAIKLRAQFRLLKEIPSLNLIGAVGSLDPIPLSGVSPMAVPRDN